MPVALIAAPLRTARLSLEPLRVEHADEMAPVLGDPDLYSFTGGQPADVGELRDRYARQVLGRSPDGAEDWLNWIVRSRDDGRTVGYVQATVTVGPIRAAADVAWVIGIGEQGRGFAGEAAGAMVEWLSAQGVDVISALLHPDHTASAAVARRAGLAPTPDVVDGEVRWILNR